MRATPDPSVGAGGWGLEWLPAAPPPRDLPRHPACNLMAVAHLMHDNAIYSAGTMPGPVAPRVVARVPSSAGLDSLGGGRSERPLRPQ